jgi:hypothetical protein
VLGRVPSEVLLHGWAPYRESAHAGQSGSYQASPPPPRSRWCGTMPR